MSPSVEITPERQEINFAYFTVDLDSPQTFDADLFDDQAERIGDENNREFRLKYIVINNKMYLFPLNIQHDAAYNAIARTLVSNPELQSSGKVSVDLLYPRENISRRQIWGKSTTLKELLTIEASEQYKREILASKLGDFFKIGYER